MTRDLESALREAREEIAIQRCHYAVSTVAWERSGKILDRIDAVLSAASGEASGDVEPHYVRRARVCGVFAQAERIAAKFGSAPSEAPNVGQALEVGNALGRARQSFLLRKSLQEGDQLRARIAELEDELATWKSVFPDIAPERVLPDRSKLEKRIAELEKERDLWKTSSCRMEMLLREADDKFDSARAEGIAAERERCAKVAEGESNSSGAEWPGEAWIAARIAAAIRAGAKP